MNLWFILLGLLCGLVLIRVVRNVKNRLQIIALVVAFTAALALAGTLFSGT